MILNIQKKNDFTNIILIVRGKKAFFLHATKTIPLRENKIIFHINQLQTYNVITILKHRQSGNQPSDKKR